jgi:DNA invertase Pin-like site-specific DNA recombinase
MPFDQRQPRRMRASIYVRLSNAATETNLSKDGMAKDLHALARTLNADVIAVHIDDGISGSVRDRHEFLEWLRDGREGKADMILAWSGDRLTREGINAAAMVLDVVEGKDTTTGKVVRPGVRFVSYDDRLDSEEGDAFRWRFVIAAEVARSERQRIVARMEARARRMLDQGRHVGRVPNGYRFDPENPGFLIVVPEEAAVIKEAARLMLADVKPSQVARSLNAAGVTTIMGAPWTRSTLVRSVTNLANAGEPLRPGTPAREAILSYADVTELRRKFAPEKTGKRGGARSPRQSKAMLAGLLLCHDCQLPMRSTSGRYVCMTAADGRTCSGAVSVTKEISETAAESAYLQRWGRVAETVAEVTMPGAAERDRLEREHAAIMARLAEKPTAADFEALQAVAAARSVFDETPPERVVRRRTTGRTLADAWKAATTEDRRDLLANAYEYAMCYPRGVSPRLVFTERPEVAELSVDEFGDVI